MYVCICNAIRESELREAAHSHDGDADLATRCSAAPQCGQCLKEAAAILLEERDMELTAKLADT